MMRYRGLYPEDSSHNTNAAGIGVWLPGRRLYRFKHSVRRHIAVSGLLPGLKNITLLEIKGSREE